MAQTSLSNIIKEIEIEKISSNIFEQQYQDWILHIGNEDSDRYEFLLVEKWDFCGCGCPKNAALAVKEMLDWCGEDIASRKSPSEFTNYQIFMLYFLDTQGYTEHGSSVNGSWITNEGKDILQFINYALEQDEKDEHYFNIAKERINEITN